jgi:hypothetical protein
MKRWGLRLLLVVSILALVFGSFGCGKEEAAVEQPAQQEAVEPATEEQPTEQVGEQQEGEEATEQEGEETTE